jgi:tetratricopeptide (TPR) repeat protein
MARDLKLASYIESIRGRLRRSPLLPLDSARRELWKRSIVKSFNLGIGLVTLLGFYGLYVLVKARNEEAKDLLGVVEERLIFRDPTKVLSAEDLRGIKLQIDQAYSRNPRSARAWALGGIYQAYIGSSIDAYRQGAMSACNNALALDSTDHVARFCHGLALFVKPDFGKAAEEFRWVVERDSLWDLAWFYYGLASLQAENWQEAENALQKARQLSPEKIVYSLDLARLYLNRKKHAEALQLLRESTAAFPESSELENALAVILYSLDQSAAAESRLLKAIGLAPDNAQYLLNMACILNNSDRSAAALPYAQRALGLAPESRDGLQETINALVDMKKYSVAEKYSSRIKRQAGEFIWVHDNHEYISGCLKGSCNGVFTEGPPFVSMCASQAWALSRFDPRWRGVTFALTVDDKIVFPPRMAGATVDPKREIQPSVELPPGSHEVKLCLGQCVKADIDPELLGLDWENKPGATPSAEPPVGANR